MKIIDDIVTLSELKGMAAESFGDMVKAVVDVDKEIIAVDAELHSDLEALLLEKGSKQKNLWGINFYTELEEDKFIEYDSLINVRPSQGNRSRDVQDKMIRGKIAEIVKKRVGR